MFYYILKKLNICFITTQEKLTQEIRVKHEGVSECFIFILFYFILLALLNLQVCLHEVHTNYLTKHTLFKVTKEKIKLNSKYFFLKTKYF